MPESKVLMKVRRPTEEVGVIDVEGEITASSEPVLQEAHQQASAGATKAVVLNFQRLDYMNSGGIGLLVTMLIRANRQGQKLAAFGLNDHYRQIFQLTRLDEAISIFESEEKALAAIA